MKNKVITVTEAARNFADCVNRVHYQNFSFTLVKNGTPVASLVPAPAKSRLGRDLARRLAEIELSPTQAKSWHRDVIASRKKLKRPVDPWQ